MRLPRVKNRMAVWDNALPPLLGKNQKRVVFSESQEVNKKMTHSYLAGRYLGRSERRNRGCGRENVKNHRTLDAGGGRSVL